MRLDLTNLGNAVDSLEAALKALGSCQGESFSVEIRETIKAGVVQNFEISYEMGWKFMKRWITGKLGTAALEGLSRKELFRLAGENGFIDNVEGWILFHHLRNQTTHTYSWDRADEVLDASPDLLSACRKLYQVIAKDND
ncbi:MAG: nucleotidyltransferase [Planctomycetota bacterium]|nr:MAG: nucleotidyltransferase [Planctomycetota bacterium]